MEENDDLSIEEEQLDTGDGAPEGDDHDEPGPAEEEPAAAADDGEPPRKNAKERRRERGRDMIRELKAHNRQLAEQLTALAARVGESVESNREMVRNMGAVLRPPPEDIGVKMRKELKEAAKRVREGDEASGEEFMAKMVEVAREMSRHETQQALQQFQQQMPRPQSPQAAALLAAAPWLADDGRLQEVKAEINRFARKNGRNMNDQRVKDATVKEVIARYAAEEGLECSFRVPAKTNGAGSVAGTGSRSFPAANGSAPPQLDAFARALADATPGFKELPPEKRYRQYYDKVILPELKT